MKTRINITHPNGESMQLEAETFVLAFKEDPTSPVCFHVKMDTDEILSTSARLSHLALKNEESMYSELETADG